ncbi:MAG: choice-of-anchor J domain-containing protein [Muribaculaceae bacterium]|nr:choice-of-anchor J domain-containing protein [Muribaculaceae bacterium]
MSSIYKSIAAILIGSVAITASIIGIGATTISPDFLKKRISEASETTVKDVLTHHRNLHRTKGSQRTALPCTNMFAENSTQRFQCVITYSDDWKYGDEAGVYTFDATAPIKFKSTFINDEYTPSGGAFFTDKYYIVTTMSEDWFTGEVDVYSYKYSRGNWEELTYTVQDIYSLYNSICYDPIDNLAYGYFYSDEGGDWGYMNPDDMRVTHIIEAAHELVAVAVNEQGQVYGIAKDGYLYSINKKTGEMTSIGSTGLSPEYMQSAAFGLDGNLYWAASEAYSSGLYIIDVTSGNVTEVGAFSGTEEICALYAVQGEVNSEAPAKATDLKAEVSGIELTFPFTFNIPSNNAGGTSLSGNIDYTVYVNGVETVSGSAEAGSKVNLSLSVEKPGYHLFKVLLSNEAGASEAATVRSWIGVDEPKSVRNAKVERLANDCIQINWEAPDGGVNGGYFDADLITYTVVRLPEWKVVAETIKPTSFTDEIELDNDQSLIRYIITPVADGLEGQRTMTDGIVIGKPYEVPVEFTFDTQEDYNIFTVIDNNETVNLDSGMWQYTPSGEAAGYVGGTKDGDDWLITPSIYLKARTKYLFSHEVLCYSDSWPEEYSVYLGTTPKIEDMTKEIVSSTTIWWDEYRTRTDTITVENDGVYYFGFHATSEAGSAFFLIDNIRLREMYSLDAPAAVKDLKVMAGETGVKKATISFVTPINNVEGKELDDDLTVRILRDGVVIETIYDVAPDEPMTYVDNDAADRQVNTYEVICSNYYGAGVGTSVKVWVGLDVPTAPLNAKVTLDKEGHPVISWKAPEGRGIHGGYVDNADLSYTVAMMRNGSLIPIVEKTSEFSCTDNDVVFEDTGSQAMHQYYVVPSSNATDEYGDNATALYISGKPYTLPFKESFKDGAPTNFWALTGTNGEGWFIGDDFSIGSQDTDDGVLSYLPAVPEIITTAMSGKISLLGANDPKLTFYLRKMSIADNGFYDTDPSKDVLNIKIGIDSFNLETITSIHLKDIKQTGEYIYYSIPLANLNSKEFVVIAFEYEAMSTRTPIMIDNISVKEICDYNAVAGEVNAPEAVEVFDNLNIKAIVINSGDNELTDVKVRLMRGTEVEAESTINTLAPDQSAEVTLEVQATPEWGEETEFTVYVVADNDEVEADNTSDPFKVKIIYHERPEVTDLTGNVEGNELMLTWSEPEGLSDLETTVTETFDSYSHGDLLFGNWKSEDKSFWGFDGIKTVIVDGKEIEIPNSKGEQAFMVFNPALAGIDIENNPEWAPISGKNLLVSFGDAANDDLESNNDWLISPELSGNTQTISFWARTAAIKGRPDDIVVLVASEIEYNNNGTVKSSCFTSLEDGDITLTREWERYEFEIPAGTKYFAIRNISEDGFAVLIDDITYAPYVPKKNANLLGYNIYCDSILLNTTPIIETKYVVSPVVDGEYTVKVVYDEGESAESNVVLIKDLSVSGIVIDNSDIRYFDLNGFRVSKPEPGKIYIRQCGDKVTKIHFR